MAGSGCARSVALRAGLEACRACEVALGKSCRLRWPNDVLEPGKPGRKLAGVLIEVGDAIATIGIGLNVKQQPGHWSSTLEGRAVSLAQLGYPGERIDAACLLLGACTRALEVSPAAAVAQWREREWLIGRRCALLVGDRRIVGRVKGITPGGALAVLRDDGCVEEVPSVAVSIDHGAEL